MDGVKVKAENLFQMDQVKEEPDAFMDESVPGVHTPSILECVVKKEVEEEEELEYPAAVFVKEEIEEYEDPLGIGSESFSCDSEETKECLGFLGGESGEAVTPSEVQTPFECVVCGKGFETKEQLVFHRLTHPGENPFMCSICPKSFAKSENLRGHVKTHSEERPYPCSFCPKSFKTKRGLADHSVTHGDKPECSHCGERFRRNRDLVSHIRRTHSGESRFRCSLCQKDFSGREELIEHNRIFHSGERLHKCPTCLKRFTKKSQLTVHLRTRRARGVKCYLPEGYLA